MKKPKLARFVLAAFALVATVWFISPKDDPEVPAKLVVDQVCKGIEKMVNPKLLYLNDLDEKGSSSLTSSHFRCLERVKKDSLFGSGGVSPDLPIKLSELQHFCPGKKMVLEDPKQLRCVSR